MYVHKHLPPVVIAGALLGILRARLAASLTPRRGATMVLWLALTHGPLALLLHVATCQHHSSGPGRGTWSVGIPV
jgi:hypothetical protein